jgi:hypothetical protein
MTSEPGPVPVPASVLFLRMRGWEEDLPSEQARRRDQLAATLGSALPAWPKDRRVVLEAPDGLAIVSEGDPSTALQAARLAAQHNKDGALGIALHHGPVRAVGETPEEARVQGDGIDTAAALAGVAASHPVVASQSFREALAAHAPGEASKLRAAGELVDERLRSHALFVLDPAPARKRAMRRNLLGTLGLLLVVGAGFAGREARDRYEAARRPAVLVLDIKPGGEVFVDGEARGTSPPLVRLSLAPGPHTIEVRSGRFPPLRTEVQLQPGETMELKHVFMAPPPARKPRPQRQLSPVERLENRIDRTIEKYKFW